jgi:uncharacterized MnhB-related membrane protein
MMFAWGIAAARSAAGVALLAKPELARAHPGAERMLTRLVGVRDLALGLGTAAALTRGDARIWLAAGLASDVSDAAVSLRSARDVGRTEAALGALLAVPFIAAAIAAEVARRQR